MIVRPLYEKPGKNDKRAFLISTRQCTLLIGNTSVNVSKSIQVNTPQPDT